MQQHNRFIAASALLALCCVVNIGCSDRPTKDATTDKTVAKDDAPKDAPKPDPRKVIEPKADEDKAKDKAKEESKDAAKDAAKEKPKEASKISKAVAGAVKGAWQLRIDLSAIDRNNGGSMVFEAPEALKDGSFSVKGEIEYGGRTSGTFKGTLRGEHFDGTAKVTDGKKETDLLIKLAFAHTGRQPFGLSYGKYSSNGGKSWQSIRPGRIGLRLTDRTVEQDADLRRALETGKVKVWLTHGVILKQAALKLEFRDKAEDHGGLYVKSGSLKYDGEDAIKLKVNGDSRISGGNFMTLKWDEEAACEAKLLFYKDVEGNWRAIGIFQKFTLFAGEIFNLAEVEVTPAKK